MSIRNVCLFGVFLVLLTLTPRPGTLISEKAGASARGKHSPGFDNRVEKVSIIVQQAGPASDLRSALNANGGSELHSFPALGFHVLNLPESAIPAISGRADVAYVSPNRVTQVLGHLSATTGADLVRVTSGTNVNGVDGTGIGIAVLDSGVYADHVSFLDRNNGNRIALSLDFTGENRVDDPYGHGTVVASIAAGNGRIASGSYVGIAPNARLFNLRVLNSEGQGTVAGVLGALNWVALNAQAFNIRVVNMSLGMPAIDSYVNDPICLSVRRLVDSGIVVVAAAGNNGRDVDGNKVYGQIHSPGIEPSAITVGASNTFGTDSRTDDQVASYSSRGPTRSRWADSSGITHYDNIIKPDLVAPGNKLVFAKSPGSLLITQNPTLGAGVSPVDAHDMMSPSRTAEAA